MQVIVTQTGEEMITRFVRFVLAAALGVPSIALAQDAAPTAVRLTPYAGHITFGSLADGPLGTRIASKPAPIYGLQAGLDILPNVALVGNVGYASSRLEAGLPIIGGLEFGDSQVLLYDAGVQLRLPASLSPAGIVPFVEGGAGAIRYDVQVGPLSTRSTNVAGNFGGGIDMQLGRNLGIRLMAKDYVGKFDFQEAVGLPMSGSVAHNWVVSVGLNLGLR